MHKKSGAQNGKENSSPQSAIASRSGSSGQGSDGVGRMRPLVPGQNQWSKRATSMRLPERALPLKHAHMFSAFRDVAMWLSIPVPQSRFLRKKGVLVVREFLEALDVPCCKGTRTIYVEIKASFP